MFPTLQPSAPLKLGFLTPHNPYDRMAFSGTTWFAARALEQDPDVDLRILGPHRTPGRLDRLLRHRPDPVNVDTLDLDGLDAVLGLVATPLLDRLHQTRPDLPFFHVTDATPAFLREAYGYALPETVDAAETRVVAHATATIYSSEAIADRAGQDLALPGLQPDVAPFGVNLDDLPDICPVKPPLDKLKLLFVGIDWERKGGDIALAVLDRLNATGHPTELTVVGRCPAKHKGHPGLVDAGFLNKTRARDRAKLTKLYRQAHVLILPSRGDCTPMVIAEAMAHGTPILATDTGGIPEQIGGAGAGRTLPPMAPPSEWVTALREMTADPDGYALASDAAFDRCQSVFSWTSWATTIARCLRQSLVEYRALERRIA